MTYCVININFESLMLDHDMISCSRKLNFICEVVIMLVDYLKPRRNIVMMFVDYLKHCLFSNSKVRHGTVVGEETSLSLEEGRRC